MNVTRKDYELIAAALRATRISIANGYPAATDDAERYRDAQRIAVHRATCYALADALATDNPRFDRARFLTATGCAA
jgi:hypothetical protein